MDSKRLIDKPSWHESIELPPGGLQSSVLSAFATPVVNYIWPDSDDLNRELEGFIKDSWIDHTGSVRSNVGGWHSPTDFLDAEVDAIQQLASRIRGVNHELSRAFFKPDASGAYPAFRLQGWANVMVPDGYHIPHIHPEAFWSGVYYVNGNPAVADHPLSGKLELLDPRAGGGLSAPVATPLFGRLLFDPEPGQMIVFPSWLMHYVHPFYGSGERISVAFNLSLQTAPASGHGAD